MPAPGLPGAEALKAPSPAFFLRPTEQVARELIGMRLIHEWRGRRLSGLIVETEAYLGVEDPAAHSFRGRRTPRVRSMYLAGGHAYIYLIYGMHHCLNVVTKRAGEPEAVLIRALQPDDGGMERCDGPGRLCRALKITRAHDGLLLSSGALRLEQGLPKAAKPRIGGSPRIGVDYAGHAAAWPLRFFWEGSSFLSRKERRCPR